MVKVRPTFPALVAPARDWRCDHAAPAGAARTPAPGNVGWKRGLWTARTIDPSANAGLSAAETRGTLGYSCLNYEEEP